MASAQSPDHCANCSSTNLQGLLVCSSIYCNPNVALCTTNCSECLKPCDIHDHSSCWDNHITGGKTRRATHKGRPAEDRLRVNEILQSETDIKKQLELHERDKKARWFIAGSTREDGSYGILYVTDRFESLMRSRPDVQQFPSLVSFVGETGTGKSTLIRALIKMYLMDRSQYAETPVTRIACADMLATPTSSGVHLYRDPQTATSERPILFGDCEGFNAGAGKPTSRCGWTYEDDNRVIRKISITSRLYAADTQSSAVEELYSRFLYAFSDVVCFVTKSEQTITLDFQRLLEWASRGLQASVNRTQQRTLIVVLNARIEHDEALMDEENAESRMFKSIGNVWENSPALKKIMDETNRSRATDLHIYTTKHFLLKYFTSIKVCYVPLQVNIRSDEVERQYKLLRRQIMAGSSTALEMRQRSWVHYNIQDLSRLYGLAFDHYATDDSPLDFYRAARKDNPNPQNMTDHIMNLLRHMENTEDDKLIAKFPTVVASAILNDAFGGDGIAFDPRHVWTADYRETCRNGVLQFYREHAVCSQIMEGLRCICRFSGHDDGHRYSNGELRKGSFEPQDIADRTAIWGKQIEEEFISQYYILYSNRPRLEKPSVDDIVMHRRQSLTSEGTIANLWRKLQSYKTCFSCLRNVPDYCLPCGHALCESCVADFGTISQERESEINIDRCVLCLDSWEGPQVIQMKPRCAGVRLLTLDGGGIRGILEIAMLLKVEERIGLGLRIPELFDLVIGTSTGGIIALGIGLRGLSLVDLMSHFKRIATETFKNNRAPKNRMMQAITENGLVQKILLSTRIWESIYSTDPLKKELKHTLDDKLAMFSAARTTRRQRLMRVAVTAVKNDGRQSTLIANYNHFNRASDTDFERAEDQREELMAWEAGLCTSAAPVFFVPYRKQATRTTYWDGGLSNNNPIYVAMKEYTKIWPTCCNTSPDVLISVGTGIFEKSKVELPKVFEDSWLSSLLNSYLSNINGEATWERFWTHYKESQPDIYYRLNFPFPTETSYCTLDQYDRMDELIATFNDACAESHSGDLHNHHHARFPSPLSQNINDKINQIANILIAKLFYFEPDQEREINYQGGKPSYRLAGSILCRLRRDSDPLKKLVERIHSFRAEEGTQPLGSNSGTNIDFGEALRADFRDRSNRFSVYHTIETVDPNKMQIISVRLTPAGGSEPMHLLPISGFPCTFHNLASAAAQLAVGRVRYRYR